MESAVMIGIFLVGLTFGFLIGNRYSQEQYRTAMETSKSEIEELAKLLTKKEP